jgi:hypothetical protein
VPANHSHKETTVPLHTAAISIPMLPRLAQLFALGAATFATAAPTIAIADDQSTSRVRTIEAAATRYFDLEANKAASMRALGRRIADHRASSVSDYQDLEANKARSQRLR